MASRFDFGGKQVVVTGGTSGIGAAIAGAFAQAGASVVALGLENGFDVTDEASIAHRIGGLERVDVLVNAAGIIRRVEEHNPAVFAQVLDVNLTGAMRVCAAAHGLLAQSKGSVVNVASMLSFFGSAPAPAYSASKGGLMQLTKSLALAWAGEGIRVNAVAPGWIETPLTVPLREDATKSDRILSRTPMARWGQADEVAGPVLFLASEFASFITGSILVVDGGYLAG
jgi:NAD(P)-dependent dehydrogenase (short-subunit alcohol dehydrogenase family)